MRACAYAFILAQYIGKVKRIGKKNIGKMKLVNFCPNLLFVLSCFEKINGRTLADTAVNFKKRK